MSKFGEQLALIRKNHGMTQKQMSEQLGITLRAWQRYEAGDREPNIDQLIQLADFFGVTLDYLTGRSDFIQPEQ